MMGGVVLSWQVGRSKGVSLSSVPQIDPAVANLRQGGRGGFGGENYVDDLALLGGKGA